MKLRYFVFFLLSSLLVSGQNDTIFYFSRLAKVVGTKDSASYSSELTRDKKAKLILKENRLFDNKWINYDSYAIQKVNDTAYNFISAKKGSKAILRTYTRKNNGFYVREYTNSVLSSEGLSKTIFPLIYEGYWKDYRQFNGKVMKESIYKDNQLISNKYWALDGTCINDVFICADKDPTYQEGESELLKFIAKNLRYPVSARDRNISGKVILMFVLTKEGNIRGIDFLTHVDPQIDLEALRVINLIPPDKWQPAEINNKKVNFFYAIPINFELR
jgi:Gram-negative bacterial TonB protein C-terminal